MSNAYFLVAVHPDEQSAHRAVEQAIETGFPMDRLSVLGQLRAEGDDLLGVVTPGVGQRMQVWGAHGALWGAVAGLLTGGAGVFWIPVLGPVVAVGHLIGAFTGGALGAAVGGVGLAGAAAVSQLSVALHRHGLPAEAVDELHREVEQGHCLVIAQAAAPAELAPCREALAGGALGLKDLP